MRAQKLEMRAQEVERGAKEFEERAKEVEAKAQEVKARAREVDMRIKEVEVRAMQVERRGELLQQEREGEGGREWLMEKREIDVIGESLGEGGRGEVKVAEFRGSQVAAKVLHRQLQSPYYHNTFRREMNMAAKVRHPNLVLFVGASMIMRKSQKWQDFSLYWPGNAGYMLLVLNNSIDLLGGGGGNRHEILSCLL